MPVVKVVVSGGYVGWTGTPDKCGKLVVLPLKYPLRDFFFKRLSFDVPLPLSSKTLPSFRTSGDSHMTTQSAH